VSRCELNTLGVGSQMLCEFAFHPSPASDVNRRTPNVSRRVRILGEGHRSPVLHVDAIARGIPFKGSSVIHRPSGRQSPHRIAARWGGARRTAYASMSNGSLRYEPRCSVVPIERRTLSTRIHMPVKYRVASVSRHHPVPSDSLKCLEDSERSTSVFRGHSRVDCSTS